MSAARKGTPRLLYLAHDLADPAVARRVAMFEAGGAHVSLAGFTRRNPERVERYAPTILGRTGDGRMLHRIGAVLRGLATVRARLKHVRPDVIVARNLEMLALAHRLAGSAGPPIAYECLDIHTLMLRPSPEGRALRALERALARRSQLLLTSSPAFVANHFEPNGVDLPVELIENKVFVDGEPERPAPPLRAAQARKPGQSEQSGRSGQPIRIGWFGALRCRRSFETLAAFTRAQEGRFEVVMRGRPAKGVLDDLPARTAAEPHMRFEGPYRYPDDLARIYAEVDLNWVVDFYEAGQNSSWLLPNRLYEGGRAAAVPVAVAGNETARYLEASDLGIVLPDLSAKALEEHLGALDRPGIAGLSAAVAALPASRWTHDRADCRALVARLTGLGRSRRATAIAQGVPAR